jgi:hypothetical protein
MHVFAFVLFLAAQSVSTSQISGTVKDQSGAVLPGAEVAATQTATGAKRTAVTDETGSFVLPNLPIGPYALEVSLPGFRTYIQSGIVLQVNSNPVINAVLQVGQVTDSVEVQANAAMVETRSSGVGQVIDNQRILELPLNGRQATDLIYLAGMATDGAGANLNSGVRNYPTVQLAIGGGLDSGTTYLLDGGTHNDPYNNLNLPLPFPDALQEFKVETNALPAQYGHHSSAAVNAVTKSGTNDFHGDAFEFLRNGALNARNVYAVTRDSLKRNQFGGTIGGPIKRNRLFFFGGYQGTTKRSAPNTNFAFVPTADMLAGDFTAVTSAACNTSGRPITLAAPFQNNRISSSLFAAPALALVKLLPVATDPCGKIQYSGVQNSDEHILLGRVDHQISERHSVFYRYQLTRLDQPTDYDGKNPITLSQGVIADRVHSFVLGDTRTYGSAFVMNFRATLNRAKIPKTTPNVLDLSDLGVNMFVYSPKSPRITVTNGFTVGSTSSTESIYNTTSFQFAEDISLIRGRHQIGFGANWIHAELNGSSKLNAVAPITFNGQVTNLGLADFLIGKPSQFQQSNPTTLFYRSNYLGFYLQDAWKATSRLTVNYGVRWDPYIPEYFKDGAMAHFDKKLFDQNVRSVVFKKAPVGVMFPGDPGYPGKSVANHELLKFAPRVGLAWDPHGDGSMSIRAAYGIFYNMPNLAHYSGFAQISPFGTNVVLPFPASFADPWQSQPGGNPFPFVLSPDTVFPAAGQFITFPLNPKLQYQNQWNLSVQKQIGADWLVASNYVGSNVIHLWGGREINPAVYIAGSSTLANVNQRRVLNVQNPSEGRFFGSVSEMDDGGTSNYHGLLLSVQRRRARGVTVQGNYTWSHCIGDLGNTSLGVAGTNYMIPNDRHSSRGNCTSSDRRHLFNLSTVYETPSFANSAVRMIAGGWQISGIVRAQSGQYLSVTTGVDSALTGMPAQRPNQVLANPLPAVQSVNLWINPAAFVSPAPGTYGNMGISNILGPGNIRIDMGLTRTFRVRENQSIQFRWEAFNLPNHLNPGNPVTATNNVNFGKILSPAAGSLSDPRIMQAALKYVF